MLTSTTTPKPKPRKPKLYSSEMEKELIVENLRMAVKYYGKDYLRKILKVTKRGVLRNYPRNLG